ncbi:hypothetical protein Pmani_019862 [Petrolisthes manimaculis]|uniref:Uncharacterized protein n=1 Tax=Petrolisthes manimaculis TaxID=1843537 RepID=A0AAE1PIS4_9EUCA|nr:hypothetical protein Pmani_019862 [Petrolisthes manimaculis]
MHGILFAFGILIGFYRWDGNRFLDRLRRWCWAKKDDTSYRRECKLTGGGKSPPDLSEDTKIIMDFIKEEFKHPENEFDSDNVKRKFLGMVYHIP